MPYRAKLCPAVLNYATLCYIYTNSNIWQSFGTVWHDVAQFGTVWHSMARFQGLKIKIFFSPLVEILAQFGMDWHSLAWIGTV